jgi:hypothetical protein
MGHSTPSISKPDWRKRAACREMPQEMVPDDDQLGVQLAKKICAGCPVVSACYAFAEHLTTTLGAEYAQGVWGGLTARERGTMIGLQRPPAECPGCGLICVPVSYATDHCQACRPGTRIAYADYRPQIEPMLAAGRTYQQVADALRINKNSMAAACNGWGIQSKTTSARGKRALKECGTLAAKERHRKHGESWENCACKHVPWKKGKPRGKTRPEANAN